MMTGRLDPAEHSWMRSEGLRRILAAIREGGGEARLVGGCVRDALLGRTVCDIDLAANLAPEEVAGILTKAGLKVVPTGIDHGTVTVVADHKGYEITSLRCDVETYGRHAKVAFTDDWQADAARRDFTMNALYADADGKIFDYFGGRTDLAAGRVRFIGKAEDRIREDVLRILRFFRFYAWFGKGAPDTEGLAACATLAPSLPQLSMERVWREIAKLLAANNPLPSWRLMIEEKILPHILPQANDLQRLEGLIAAAKKNEVPPDALTRFAALLPKDKAAAEKTARQLKLSNREAEKLLALAVLPDRLRGRLDPIPFRSALYEYGTDACRAAALLLAAEMSGTDLEPALAAVDEWENPVLPIQGEDILKLGIGAGPEVGEILRAVEEWWIAQDFRPDHAACLAEAKKHLT